MLVVFVADAVDVDLIVYLCFCMFCLLLLEWCCMFVRELLVLVLCCNFCICTLAPFFTCTGIAHTSGRPVFDSKSYARLSSSCTCLPFQLETVTGES